MRLTLFDKWDLMEWLPLGSKQMSLECKNDVNFENQFENNTI